MRRTIAVLAAVLCGTAFLLGQATGVGGHGVVNTVTNPLGALTLNKCVMGNGAGSVSVDANCNLDGSGNITLNSAALTTALSVPNGGWGLQTLTAHALYAGNGTGAPNAILCSITGQTLSGSNGADPICTSPGIPGRTVSGASDTILCDSATAVRDRSSFIEYSNAGAVAVTLPQANSSGCGSNFVFGVHATNAATVITITPTTSKFQPGNNATLVVNGGEWCTIKSEDNTDYWAHCSSGQITAGSGITFTRSATGSSIASTLNVNAVAVNSPNLANNFQVLGSNIYWTNTPQFVTGFGDSITAGSTGVTGSNQDFLDLIAIRTGGGETNYATSGAQAADVAKLQVIANTQTMTAPPLVVGNLATSTSGGSLAAATSDCVKITYNTVLGETTPSPEACIVTGAGSSNSITVTAPIPANGQAGYLTGYTVYSGLTTAELKQAASNNCVNISIGANCIIQVLGAGAAPPGTNTAYLPNTTEDNLTLGMVGTNDVTQYGATASLQTVFQQTLDTAIVWSSSATPVFGQGSSCVGTGAWSNDNTGLSGLGTQSTTNGNTLACSNIQVNNGVLYVIYRIINGDGGTFTVKDGTTVLTDQITNASTLNGFPGASMTTLNGTTDSFATARFTGLSNGLHTINFTVTSATNGANVVSISALSTVPGLTYATPERIYVGGVIKQQSDANSALTAAYNTLVKNQVTALSGDGLLAYFVDVRSYVNSTSDMFNSLHPNNIGQAHLRDAFAAQIQYPMNNSFYQLCFGQLTPQVSGPDACLYRQNAGELSLGSLTRGTKTGTLDVAAVNIYNGATIEGIFSNGGFTQSSGGYVGFSSSSTAATPVVAKITGNGATGVFLFGSGSGGSVGFVKTSQTLQVTGSNYTTSSTTLAAAGVITGLSFTTPTSFASNWSFDCDLTYSQATAAAANLWGITTSGTAPTSMLANATVLTSNANAGINGSATITTATSTTVVTATPSAFGAIGTVADMFQAHLSGTIEAPSNASPSIFGIAVATGNASDALTIYRGSKCWVH